MSNDNNPYAASTADLELPKSDQHVGGSLEGGIAGNYDFAIGAMIKEAWEKTNGLKGSFWAAAILLFIGAVALSFALGIAFGMPSAFDIEAILALTPEELDSLATKNMIVQLIMTVVMYPFMVGVMMMGVKRSVDQPISFNMMFAYFAVATPVIIAGVLITILTTIGLMLLIIPGLYLIVAYGLALPLIADKKLSAWAAMEASRKAISKRWFKIFGLYIVMLLIILVSMIPLGLGLIWTYPMLIALMGILYREIFGITSA